MDVDESKRYFHCTAHEWKYSNSKSTIGVLLYLQFHSNDEIAHFSMDSDTDFTKRILY